MLSLCKQVYVLSLTTFVWFALLVSTAHAYSVSEVVVKRSEWPTYVNGTNLLSVVGLKETLSRFDEKAGQRIIVRYPGGASGQLWARQVRDWFIAYGVPRRFIETGIGSGAADQLLLLFIDENSES